jgi:hypothetical protein
MTFLRARRLNVQKLDRGGFRPLPVVEAEQSTDALPAYEQSGPVEVGGRQDELAAQALMVSLSVVVSKVIADRGAQMALAEKDVYGQLRVYLEIYQASG